MKNLPQKVRSRKLSSKVDLTAMVSVSFLLIIFFMVVGELSKPKTLELSLPDRYDITCGTGVIACYRGDNFYTVLLGENNKIVTYAGLLPNPMQDPKETNYSKNGFRAELTSTNKKILEYSAATGRPNRGAIVFIKPSKKNNYGNLVTILDEIKIAGIKSYSIVDQFTPEETKLLASK